MLHNQKILSFGDQIAGGRRVRCSALRGCAQLLPIAALIRPLVNFDVEACTRDIIMTAAPGRGREHGAQVVQRGSVQNSAPSSCWNDRSPETTTCVFPNAARPLGEGTAAKYFALVP